MVPPGKVLATASLCVLILGTAACVPAEARTPDPDHRTPAERIDEIFAPLDSPRAPGCAVGVVDPEGLRFARGYGMANLDHGVPLRPRSIFRIASVSKQFTAAVALLLDEEGLAGLDDPVQRWVPELPDYGEPLTIRHLVHHTSGLRDYLALQSLAGFGPRDLYSDDDVVAILARQEELNFPSGNDHLYSNSGYFLLSRIVEEASGRTLREYAEDRIFEPLDMPRTHFHDDHTRIVEDRAIGYAPRPDGGFRVAVTELDLVGDGGIFTSVEEMARWERFHLTDLDHPLAVLRERMLERGVLANGDTVDYAFGVSHGSYRGLATVGHGGSFVGYRTHALRFPDEALSVVVFCNRTTANPGELARLVAEVYLEDRMDPPPEPGDEPAAPDDGEAVAEPPAPTAEALEAYRGAWWSPELEVTYRLSVEEGALRLTAPDRLAGELEPVAPDTFRLGGARFTFERGGEGVVRELRVQVGRAGGLRFERVDGEGRPATSPRSDRSPGPERTDAHGTASLEATRPLLVDPLPAEVEVRLDSVFVDLDRVHSPGCALGIEEEGGLRLARGYGMADLEQGAPLGPGTVFRIGSTSKQFAAAALALLELDGELSLEDDVRDHLPELPDFGEPITLRQVLNHTSGLRDWLTLRSLQGRPGWEHYTRADVFRLMEAQQDLNFSPGARHLYSNTGYLFAADIVERITGQSLRDFTAERIFRPLGMLDTRFHDDPDEIVERRATGYAPRGSEGYRISTSPLDVVGAGGLLTSVEDFARWGHFLTRPHEVEGGPPPELVELLVERGLLTSGDTIGYALGLTHGEIRGLRTVGHGGSWQGYRASFLTFPEEGVSISVFCNVSDGNPGGRARRAAEVFLGDRMEPAPEGADEALEDEPEEAREEPALEPAALDELVGEYRSPELGVVYRFEREGDRLVLTPPGGEPAELSPEGEERFRRGGTLFRFVRDGEGRVREVRVDAGRVLDLLLVPVEPGAR